MNHKLSLIDVLDHKSATRLTVSFWKRTLGFASLLVTFFTLGSHPVQAEQLINVDLTGPQNDTYTGAAVFGTSSSQWNELSRFSGQSNTPLADDTGAATSVTVSYSRSSSSTAHPSGALKNLGTSALAISSPLTLSGLTPNGSYSLVLINPNRITYTVNGVSKTISGSYDFNSLTSGINYVQFDTTADSYGNLSATFSNPDFINTQITSFQLKVNSAAVPEAGTNALLFVSIAVTGAGFASRRLRRK